MKIQPNQDYNNYLQKIQRQGDVQQQKGIKPEEELQKQQGVQPDQSVKKPEEIQPDQKVQEVGETKDKQTEEVPEIDTKDKTSISQDAKKEMAQKDSKVDGMQETGTDNKSKDLKENLNEYGKVKKDEATASTNIKEEQKPKAEDVKKVAETEGIKEANISEKKADTIADIAKKKLDGSMEPAKNNRKRVAEEIQNAIKNYLEDDKKDVKDKEEDGQEINKSLDQEIDKDPEKFLKEQKFENKAEGADKDKKENKWKKADINVDVMIDPKMKANSIAPQGREVAKFDMEISGADADKINAGAKEKLRKNYMRLVSKEGGNQMSIPEDGTLKADTPMKMNFIANQGKLAPGQMVFQVQGLAGQKPFEMYAMQNEGKDKKELAKEYLEKNPQAEDAHEVRKMVEQNKESQEG